MAWLLGFLGITANDLEDLRPIILKLHKAAYFLKLLRVYPFSLYDFDSYIHGPYSTILERDVENTIPNISDRGLELLLWFLDHDNRWLEVATSILMIKESYHDIGDNEVLLILRMSKPWVTDAEFNEIIRQLRDKLSGVIAYI